MAIHAFSGESTAGDLYPKYHRTSPDDANSGVHPSIPAGRQFGTLNMLASGSVQFVSLMIYRCLRDGARRDIRNLLFQTHLFCLGVIANLLIYTAGSGLHLVRKWSEYV